MSCERQTATRSARAVVFRSNVGKSGSGVSDYRLGSSFSRRSSGSMSNGRQTNLEPVGSKSISPSSLTTTRITSKGGIVSKRKPNPNQQEKKPMQQKEKKPREKVYPAEAQLRKDLNNCSRDGALLKALDIYDQSRKDGSVRWNQYNYNILLYLCSSAALGTLTANKSGTDRPDAERLNLQPQNLIIQRPSESANGAALEKQCMNAVDDEDGGATTSLVVLTPEVMELAVMKGFEIYEDMKRMQVRPNEATLTAVARLAVKKEDGDLAFQMVKEMAAMNIAPKLRSYSPALIIFCKFKAVKKVFELDAHMLAAGVQPEEPELGALLQLCVELGLDKEVYSLLHRIRVQARELSPKTASVIEEWFSGTTGALAGKDRVQPDAAAIEHAVVAGGGGWHGLGWLGEGEWKLRWTTIDMDGVCCSCGEKLVTIDLDPQETEAFAESLFQLAISRQLKPNEFAKFQEWLVQHGPFDAIVDGANIGLYNQNYLQNGFNFFQLGSVVRSAQEHGLTKKPPLIVLHNSRAKTGTANSNLGKQLLHRWSSSNSLFTTPTGSNDDWYWLYAAVKNKCLLITNDEMRDHLFQLLGTDFFPKWKERHQVRFSVSPQGPSFHLPPPYSLVIQESEKGSWHIPKSGGNDIDSPREWLCVTRPRISSGGTAPPDSATTVENMTQLQEVGGAALENRIVPKSHDPCATNGNSEASGRPRRSQAPVLPELSPNATLRDNELQFTVSKDQIASAKPKSLEADGTGKARGRPKRSRAPIAQDILADSSPEVGVTGLKDQVASTIRVSLEVSGNRKPSGRPRKTQANGLPDSSQKAKIALGLTQESTHHIG